MIDPLDVLDDAQVTLERLAQAPPGPEVAAALSLARRAEAAGLLLSTGDVSAFRRSLRASAAARGALLAAPVPPPGAPQRRFFARAQVAPLVDALVAEDDATARALAPASPRTILTGVEYDEDHHHAALIEALVLHDPRAGFDVGAHLAALAALEASGPSPRTQALAALHAVDLPAFSAALAAWVDAREAERAAHARALLRAPFVTFVDDALFFEGLALVRFARGLGLPPPAAEPGLPELVLAGQSPWSWA